jgi:hypothetical protein
LTSLKENFFKPAIGLLSYSMSVQVNLDFL